MRNVMAPGARVLRGRLPIAAVLLLALATVGPLSLHPSVAAADECSELLSAIRQLDQQIANMGSGGVVGGGSGGQVGALRDQRANLQNAYNSLNCANGGPNQSYQSQPQRNTGMDALVLGAGILDNMINADRERSRQAALEQQARRQREEAERQRIAAERMLEQQRAEQRTREADARMRNATANPFGAPAANGNPFARTQPAATSNPFATPFTPAPAGTLVAPNENAVMSAIARPVMEDLHARGVTGCPTGEPLANYCALEPPWWRTQQPGRAYSQASCASYVQAATLETPQCTLRYRSRLERSQAEVRNQGALLQHQQRCAANPSLEECEE
jgi:hypothetical protein